MDGGARNGRQEQRRKGKKSSGAGAQEAAVSNAKCKGKKPPPSAYRIYRPRGVLSGVHAPRALTTGGIFPH
jgi:hypothetical protein